MKKKTVGVNLGWRNKITRFRRFKLSAEDSGDDDDDLDATDFKKSAMPAAKDEVWTFLIGDCLNEAVLYFRIVT